MLRLALLCHLSAVSAIKLAENVDCLPKRDDELLVDFSISELLHNNLGGVAGAYCVATGGECVTTPSQLGDVGVNTYPGCAGKTVQDSCYTGMGALAPNQRSPRWDWPASPSTSSRVHSFRKRPRLNGHGHGGHVRREHHALPQLGAPRPRLSRSRLRLRGAHRVTLPSRVRRAAYQRGVCR